MIHLKNKYAHITLLSGAALAALVWFGIQAGPLEPPVPPGVETMHPIDQVDPRIPIYPGQLPMTINESGSYYLAGPVSTVGGGIVISAPQVTLDLMGFTLAGGNGIGVDATDVDNVTVRNGIIRGWSGTCLRMGSRGVAERVTAAACGGRGIVTKIDSLVTDCVSSGNVVHGIIVHTGSIVRGCAASNNYENGIWVTSTGLEHGALITGCVVDFNSKNGIRVDGSATVLENHCRGNDPTGTNDKAGIWVNGDHSRVEGNHVIENTIGIDLSGDYNFIGRNTLRGDFVQNWRVDGSATGNLMLNWTTASPDPPGAWDNLEL
jgi:hypothetical protein